MDRQLLKSTDLKLRSQGQTRSSLKKGLVLGSVVATLIAATPFIFNLYQSVPETKVWDTFLFTYDSKYYEDASVVAWTLMNKIIPLYLIFIWFFTCRHWWYHVLLVPIAMYVYQIIITLNSDLYFVDGNEIIYILPIMAIIVPSIYLLRAQMFTKIIDNDKSLEELEEEFKIKPKSLFQRLGDYF
mgnify:CR=1 FL=1